jgi:DNA-directed RNA polymerase beta' subunit
MLLNDIVIKGIPNITNIVASNMNNDYIYQDEDYICKNSGKVKCNKDGSEGEQKDAIMDNWVLETDGVNLSNIMTHNKVDYTKCFSNDILEMQLYLGIEAAREMLLKEMYAVVDDAGEYVNLRHLQLLVDLMTSRGVIMPTNRQGINRGDNGTLAKMSFEDTTEQIMKAGLFGDCDNLKGVSANIMMGQVVPCGTGNFDILLDEEIIKKNVQEKTEEIDDKEINVEEMLDGSDEEDAYCNDEHLDFSFNVE